MRLQRAIAGPRKDVDTAVSCAISITTLLGGGNMRHLLTAIAILLLALATPSQSQLSANGYPDFDAPETEGLMIVKVILKGGCFLYDQAGNGAYLDGEDDEFLWSGFCTAGQPINGPGVSRP